MPTITFPFEIKETILEFLAAEDGHSTLKRCSLVCQEFLPICRKHIFESIALNHSEDYEACCPSSPSHAFGRLICETPEIADYIRKLDYNILTADLNSSSIQEALKKISRLEFLSVRYRLYWSNSPIRPTLLHLLHLPTLTHFKMNGINDFLVSDLIPCVNLKYLDIGVYTSVAAETTFHAMEALPEHSIQLPELVARDLTSTTIMKFCSAQRPDGQPIIDFGSLSKITVAVDDLDEPEELQELFRRCHALTNACISFLVPHNLRLSLSDMLRPSMQTLRHIVVNIHVFDYRDDSLLGIPSEFEDMSTKNIIETLTIRILVRRYARYRLLAGELIRLDEILTSPGWFSLKRVSLALEIPPYNINIKDSKLKKAMQILPKQRFPRLSSSISVLLDINLKVRFSM